MRVLLAGAAGNLGRSLVAALLDKGHEVTAVDAVIAPLEEWKPRLARIEAVDLQVPATFEGLCEGMDCVITTVGIGKPKSLDAYDKVDYKGNHNLLRAAEKAGVGKFVYTSIFNADSDDSVPMLKAKARMESALKASSIDWIIIRPCGYFIDIWRTFMGSAKKGSMLLVGKDNPRKFNPIHTDDLALWIEENLGVSRQTLSAGGPEEFTYREITGLCFDLLGKPAKVSELPHWFFGLFLAVMRLKDPPTWAVMRFLRWARRYDRFLWTE